ncbi:hypothetical protein WIW50_07760 [Flavobacteriaceae bacterium 3-367]|uniref:hypothetical protein n=1 Tax=Eudoraea algarum TaxID=3417568 RepID=UPI0032734AA6
MNKAIPSIFLAFFILNTIAQEKRSIYVDDKNDYVFFLEKGTNYTSKDIKNVEIDAFAKNNPTKFNYTLVVSKIYGHNFVNGNLLDDSYETFFLNNCNCSILDKEIIIYNNLKTLRYKIHTESQNNKFIGYNDSFMAGKTLYNVLFLAFEADFENEENKYSEIMNTLIINGKTTIDGYNQD